MQIFYWFIIYLRRETCYHLLILIWSRFDCVIVEIFGLDCEVSIERTCIIFQISLFMLFLFITSNIPWGIYASYVFHFQSSIPRPYLCYPQNDSSKLILNLVIKNRILSFWCEHKHSHIPFSLIKSYNSLSIFVVWKKISIKSSTSLSIFLWPWDAFAALMCIPI